MPGSGRSPPNVRQPASDDSISTAEQLTCWLVVGTVIIMYHLLLSLLLVHLPTSPHSPRPHDAVEQAANLPVFHDVIKNYLQRQETVIKNGRARQREILIISASSARGNEVREASSSTTGGLVRPRKQLQLRDRDIVLPRNPEQA